MNIFRCKIRVIEASALGMLCELRAGRSRACIIYRGQPQVLDHQID
jgi:hypothetical protein